MAEVFLMACDVSKKEIYREKIYQFASFLYLQRKYASKSELYIAAIKLKVIIGSVKAKFYYIPIIKTVKQLLSDKLISMKSLPDLEYLNSIKLFVLLYQYQWQAIY